MRAARLSISYNQAPVGVARLWVITKQLELVTRHNWLVSGHHARACSSPTGCNRNQANGVHYCECMCVRVMEVSPIGRTPGKLDMGYELYNLHAVSQSRCEIPINNWLCSNHWHASSHLAAIKLSHLHTAYIVTTSITYLFIYDTLKAHSHLVLGTTVLSPLTPC